MGISENVFKTGIKNIKHIAKKNAPVILTGLTVAGVVSTMILSFKAAPKAKEILEKLEKENADSTRKIKELAPVLASPALMCATTIACAVAAHKVNGARIAALSATYSLLETNSKIYAKKVKELIGEKKEEKIKEDVIAEKIKGVVISENNVISTGHGNTLCYDTNSGRYFRSSAEFLKKRLLDADYYIINHNLMSLNDFYDQIDLDHIKIGNEIGWDATRGHRIDPEFRAKLTDNDEPCLVLDLDPHPLWD